jgi:hypothetical protein
VQFLIVLIARNCAPATAAASTASLGQPAAAGKLLQLLQAGPKEQQPTRKLQENTVAAADLQQTLQKMLAVPIATPQCWRVVTTAFMQAAYATGTRWRASSAHQAQMSQSL